MDIVTPNLDSLRHSTSYNFVNNHIFNYVNQHSKLIDCKFKDGVSKVNKSQNYLQSIDCLLGHHQNKELSDIKQTVFLSTTNHYIFITSRMYKVEYRNKWLAWVLNVAKLLSSDMTVINIICCEFSEDMLLFQTWSALHVSGG